MNNSKPASIPDALRINAAAGGVLSPAAKREMIEAADMIEKLQASNEFMQNRLNEYYEEEDLSRFR